MYDTRASFRRKLCPKQLCADPRSSDHSTTLAALQSGLGARSISVASAQAAANRAHAAAAYWLSIDGTD